MKKNIADHLEVYKFKVGEVVIVGGNPNVLGEVINISDSVQIAVRILTPPLQGKTVYTTRFTYFTTPMPHLTVTEVREMYNSTKRHEFKLTERSNIPVENEESLNEPVVATHEVINEPILTNKETMDVPVTVPENVTTVFEETSSVVDEKVKDVFSVKQEIVDTEEVFVAQSSVEDDFTQLSLF